jgi:hypothetical protein
MGWISDLLGLNRHPSAQASASGAPGGAVGYRVQQQWQLYTIVNALATVTLTGNAHVRYDDGTEYDFFMPPTTYAAGTYTETMWSDCFKKNGTVTALEVHWIGATPPRNAASVVVGATRDLANPSAGAMAQLTSCQINSLTAHPSLGVFMPEDWAYATFNVALKQSNVAGGAIVIDITPGTGNVMVVADGRVLVSIGTNAFLLLKSSVSGSVYYGSVPSTSGAAMSFPAMAVSTTQTGTTAAALSSQQTMIFYGTDSLTVQESLAGAQNDQLQLSVRCLIKGGLPTVSFARSTNPADVSVIGGSLTFVVV